MSRKKILLVLAGVVVLALGGAVAWLYLSLDGMVARAIEKAGTEVTGTRVSVGRVSISLRDGTGLVRNLRVANPDGFSRAPAVEIERITLALDTASVTKKPVVVESVELVQPRIRFEVNADGKANLDVIRKHAEAAGASAEPDPDPVKIRIKSLTAPDGQVDADVAAVGGKNDTLKLKTIRMSNVGGRDGGTSDEVAAAIVSAVGKEVASTAAKEGLRRYLGDQADQQGGKVKDKLKGLFGK